MSADTVTVHQVTCDHCGHTAHIGTRPSALDWALADLGWKGDTTKLCPACADAGEDRMVASGYRITTTEETAVTHDEPQPPIPADDQAHAYVVVERTHSPHADRPEWDRPAIVIPAHEASDLAYWRGRPDHALIPIGPDGDTGTRAVVEPRTVSTVAELDALPIGATILLEYGVVAQAVGGDEDIAASGWMGIGHDLLWTSAQVVKHAGKGAGKGASFTVLYVPEAACDGE